MNIDSVIKIIQGVLPDAKDMEFIQTYGLVTWLIVFLAKILGFFATIWFLVKIIKVKLSIGK